MRLQDTEYTFPKFEHPAHCCAGYEGQKKCPENKSSRPKKLVTTRNAISLAKR